ncbi:MAG: NAD(P)H-hydrate dehydratase [Candidatus Gracilibacteria bacterium]|nr:NAD(P)H-hydrate dehydratase [Candidatus Gracilibacteria bacterium]MDD5178846.1 NAD(P)H-hydrate dehydratase [Candidatus Gracilibacteria bacterium]
MKASPDFSSADVKSFFPKRGKNSHKGKNGEVVIVGGSRNYVGAASFAAGGAIAAGCDLVYLFTPEVNFAVARKFSPNVLVRSFAGDKEKLTKPAVKAIVEFAKKRNATLVVGCGLDFEEAALFELLRINKQPIVLDAAALVKNLPLPFKNSHTILTPHAREFARIAGKLSPEKFAMEAKATLLIKKPVDIIVSKRGEIRYNRSGNPILTVGGSGDTLAGLVGGLVARGMDEVNACGIGSFLLGKAGEILAEKMESVTPQLLAKEIPKLIRKLVG